MTPMREHLVKYLKNLRDNICEQFESIERMNPQSTSHFERTAWNHKNGPGGGEMSVIRGQVFEKAAVNWSQVEGDKFPGDDASGPFFATGVSLITHMTNPKAPTVHFNIRYIETAQKKWIGGGFDLTPMGFPYAEDTEHFHHIAKQSLDPFGLGIYEKFSLNAKEYFTIKHYNAERGVGGIFFDHYNTGNWDQDLSLWKSVGDNFTKSIIPIYKKRVLEPYTEHDRKLQLKMRGRYVEFNLLYDRGTQFGFKSGGNPEAILCSMPPLVSW
jgi:coproporphyrinogen III oxidase